MKGFAWFILSFLLASVLMPLGLIYALFKPGRGRYFSALAEQINRTGNVVCGKLFNQTLIKQEGYQFGYCNEWISSAIGKNKIDGTLSPIGRGIDKILELIEKDHSIKNIQTFNMKQLLIIPLSFLLLTAFNSCLTTRSIAGKSIIIVNGQAQADSIAAAPMASRTLAGPPIKVGDVKILQPAAGLSFYVTPTQLNTALAKYATNDAAFTKQIADLKATIDLLDKNDAGRAADINSLKAQVQGFATRIKTLSADSLICQKRFAAIETAATGLTGSLADLKKLVDATTVTASGSMFSSVDGKLIITKYNAMMNFLNAIADILKLPRVN